MYGIHSQFLRKMSAALAFTIALIYLRLSHATESFNKAYSNWSADVSLQAVLESNLCQCQLLKPLLLLRINE
jgi:hypothetical protein